MSIAPNNPLAAFALLVSRNRGFELMVYNKYVWTTVGGKDNDIWYIEEFKGENRRKVARFATLVDGEWRDSCYLIKGGETTPQPIASGETMALAAEKLYYGQDLIDESKISTNSYLLGVLVRKFTFNFGAEAYDISQQHGVTVGVIIKNNDRDTYRMRKLLTGDDVVKPSI